MDRLHSGDENRVPGRSHEAPHAVVVVDQPVAGRKVVGEHHVLDLVDGERLVNPVKEREAQAQNEAYENRRHQQPPGAHVVDVGL